MRLKSMSFKEGEMIPSRHTCEGADISPQLEWEDIPAGTKSLALVCDDPDAPGGDWVHWVYYNIPASLKTLHENIGKTLSPPEGGSQGLNNFRKHGYGGPCPPSGTHRYYFRLYALDTVLSLPPGAERQQLEKAMKGHITAAASLMGKYKRR